MPIIASADSAASPALLPASAATPAPVDAPGSGGNTRTLRFKSVNLAEDLHLMLMFTPPPNTGKLYEEIFPICWKVITLPAAAIGAAKVVYTARTAFMIAQVNNGDMVEASVSQACETGQMCTIAAGKDIDTLSVAAPGSPGIMKCVNTTGRPIDITIGFLNEKKDSAQPALNWKTIANLSSVAVKLTPTLRIYSAGNYKETQLLRGDVQTPLLFEENLENLPSDSKWVVSISNPGLELKITREL